jgi:hypothetical protein
VTDLETFDREWDELASGGACDSRGGAGYRRVRDEWEASGRTRSLASLGVSVEPELPIGLDVRPVVLDDREELEALGVHPMTMRESTEGGARLIEARIVARGSGAIVARVVVEHPVHRMPQHRQRSTRAVVALLRNTGGLHASMRIRSADIEDVSRGLAEVALFVDSVRRGSERDE